MADVKILGGAADLATKPEPEQEPRTSDPGEVKVDMSVQEDDDGPETQQEEQPSKPSWKEKKASRWRQHTEEARLAREALEAEREQNRLLREQIARNTELGNRFYERMERQAAAAEVDPFEEKYKTTLKARDDLQSQYRDAAARGNVTPEIYDMYQQRMNAVEDELRDLSATRALRRVAPRVDPNEESNRRVMMQINATHPDVMANPRADTYAQHVYQAKLAAGRQPSWDLLNEAMNEARRAFGMAPKETGGRYGEQVRRMYVGPPRSGAQGAAEPETEVLSKQEMDMARTLWPREDEEVVARRFVRTVKRG